MGMPIVPMIRKEKEGSYTPISYEKVGSVILNSLKNEHVGFIIGWDVSLEGILSILELAGKLETTMIGTPATWWLYSWVPFFADTNLENKPVAAEWDVAGEYPLRFGINGEENPGEETIASLKKLKDMKTIKGGIFSSAIPCGPKIVKEIVEFARKNNLSIVAPELGKNGWGNVILAGSAVFHDMEWNEKISEIADGVFPEKPIFEWDPQKIETLLVAGIDIAYYFPSWVMKKFSDADIIVLGNHYMEIMNSATIFVPLEPAAFGEHVLGGDGKIREIKDRSNLPSIREFLGQVFRISRNEWTLSRINFKKFPGKIFVKSAPSTANVFVGTGAVPGQKREPFPAHVKAPREYLSSPEMLLLHNSAGRMPLPACPWKGKYFLIENPNQNANPFPLSTLTFPTGVPIMGALALKIEKYEFELSTLLGSKTVQC